MQAETSATVDILAIAAHRVDVEQTCGGTLLVQQSIGWRIGILDLTRGESGTRGTAAERESRLKLLQLSCESLIAKRSICPMGTFRTLSITV
jgi:LmbE family N-acetylglucosaminyl deacetylase